MPWVDRPEAGERLAEWRDEDGSPAVAIDHDGIRYRFVARGAGVYELRVDGTHVLCK